MKGKPFEVSLKVLKLNMHQKSHYKKMTPKYLGPYTIRSCSSTGNCYLTDRYSHWLKKSVPTSQLVKFYENKGSYQKKATTLNNHLADVDKSFDPLSSMNDSDSDSSSNCKRMRSYQPTSHVVTSTPIKSQIIIMSSKEMPPSSDESEMIDVASEMSIPFGNINVDEIPIEIVDDLMDIQQDNSEIQVTDLQSNPYIIYEPLDDEDQIKAVLKFNLVINSNTHPVKHYGVGDRLSSPPTVTISAKGNGVCLFNSLSLLLTGRDTYSAIIWHVVCNYIDNPVEAHFSKTLHTREFCDW